MSRHEGVSCDACLKANFRGRRYKCLICYDYDLCSSCYESGSTTSRHTTEHPMQCILTRHDFDIFHGGEALTADTPQSLTCPFCCKMGFTETTLQEHVASTHPDTAFEVVCPICASVPGGDPNHVTDEFGAHLSLDHRSGAPRELDVSETTAGRQGVRRMTQGRGLNRGPARQNMRFGSVNGGFFSSSPRESNMDPIAELLSQLSGVRRATATTRQQQQQLERLPARRGATSREAVTTAEITANHPAHGTSHAATAASNNAGVTVSLTSTSSAVTASNQSNISVPVLVQSSGGSTSTSSKQSAAHQQNFLLSRLVEDLENEPETATEAQSRASFIQELLLSTLSDLSLGPPPSEEPPPDPEKVKEKEEDLSPTSIDASTQTPSSPMVPLTHSLTSPANVPLFHNSPIGKASQPSPSPFNKKSQKMVVRGSAPLQPQPPNGANQGRGNGGGGGRGGAKPPSGGGAVSPSSNRRKPFKNLDGSKASQPPPPH